MRAKIVGSIVLVGLLLFSMFMYAKPSGGEGKLEYKVYAKKDIISAAYKAYGNPKLGMWVAKVVLYNTGKGAIRNIKISYSIDTYSQQISKTYPILVPGGTLVDLYYPIISSDVTKLTMPTPSNLRIRIEYEVNGKKKTEEITKSLQILGIHDFIFSSLSPEESTGSFYDAFSNAPLIVAWVTTTDPVVREFADMGNRLAGGAGASLSDEEAIKSLSGIWQLAVVNGFSYKTEPSSYWTSKAAQHVMYPRDVIRDKSGTCLDLAIWFATLATTQGLKAYIVFMPGHAFPLIQLPSGSIIPVEATAINSKVSFQDAVKMGLQTWQKATQGPYQVIDIAEYQSDGIIPPELPQLPPNVLKEWGISAQTQGGGAEGGTGNQEGGGEWVIYNGNGFSFQYPANWQQPEDYGGYVYLVSNDEEFEFIVMYAQGYTVQDMVQSFEQTLQEGGITIKARKETQADIAGITAYAVLYSLSSQYGDFAAVARYFTSGGTAYAVIYDFPRNNQEYNQLGEQIVSTFRLG